MHQLAFLVPDFSMRSRSLPVALLTGAFAALCAFAEAQPPVPVDADVPALRGQNLALVPGAILSGGYDSNIHREGPPNGPIPATELFGVASYQLFGRFSAVELNAAGGAEAVSFRDLPGEGGLSWAQRASVQVGLSRVRPKASLRYSDTYARPSGFEIGERSRHQELNIGGGVDLRLSPRAVIGAEAHHLSLDYEGAEEYQGSSLHETLSLDLLVATGQFSYDVTPLTTVSVMGSYDRNRFREAGLRDTDGGLAAVGVSMARPAMLSGNGQVGIRWFRPLHGTADTFLGVTGTANLVYARPTGTLLQFRFNRDTQFSYDPALGYYVFTDGGVLLHFTIGGWKVGSGASHQWLDYRLAGTAAGAGRVDHRTAAGAMIGHRVGRGMEVGVNGEYAVKTGPLAFSGTRVMAYWSIGRAVLMRFDRPLPGELH